MNGSASKGVVRLSSEDWRAWIIGDGYKSAQALVAVAHNLVCDEPAERTAMARLMVAYARELDPDAVLKPRLDG
jgi:hypothetical protein